MSIPLMNQLPDHAHDARKILKIDVERFCPIKYPGEVKIHQSANSERPWTCIFSNPRAYQRNGHSYHANTVIDWALRLRVYACEGVFGAALYLRRQGRIDRPARMRYRFFHWDIQHVWITSKVRRRRDNDARVVELTGHVLVRAKSPPIHQYLEKLMPSHQGL
ncbi:unnamed protein product [Hymenolepis diminuta]|uniref:Thioesterase n=1 Tax=Hymenolepis diminuta TaxID=6216 RepID=A0A158QBP9_HYMDI|nr:unnamed protein product [Hymenolepis diminuta]